MSQRVDSWWCGFESCMLDAKDIRSCNKLLKFWIACYKGISFFWTYLNSIVFMCSKCTIQSHIINFQPFLTSFVIFHAFTDFFSYKTLKLKSISNELWKGWKLAWYHHFTHIACAKKLRGLREKLDALRVQNGQSLSKYQGFERKLVCYKGISLFWTYLNSGLFVCSKCTIQRHIINFEPILTSVVFFMHLLIFWAIWPWNWKAL